MSIPAFQPRPLCAAVAVVMLIWLAAVAEDWRAAFPLSDQKNDYYNLLVDGFQEGHLHLKAEVHPGRLSPDPQVRARAPYLLDASQYNGRYYLYFGVVPVLLLFWPYAALTGHDCPPNLAVLLAAAAAFLFWLRIYTEARARYFPTARAWLDVTAVGLLALGSGLPVLLVSGGMYEVALAWGGLWVAVLFWSLFRALHSERHTVAWLAAASLAYGLGVGCRPTIFLLGPLLPLVAWLAARKRPQDRVRLLGAVVIPAGAIGLGLMLYNHARFDSPFEFGLNHQVNAIAGGKLQDASFVPANVDWYYFTPPTLSAYFPYLYPHSSYPMPAGYYAGSEPTHGQPLLTMLAAVCALAAWRHRPALPRPLGWFLGLLGFAFGVMLLVNASFAYRSSRYLVDFQPMLVLSLLLAAGLVFAGPARPGWRTRLWPVAVGALATLAWVSSLLIACQFLDRFAGTHPQAFRSLAFYGNQPAGWLARLGLHHYGPLRFKVVFTPQPEAVAEVLVATGAPGSKDILFAGQYPNGQVDFAVYHEGHGGARSALIPIEYGRPYEIELTMGSLYPPIAATYFPGWGELPRAIVKDFTRVTVDGVTVIRTRQPSYDSSPGLLTFGRAPGRPERSFSGRLDDVRRTPMPDAAQLKLLAETGVWRFEFMLPPGENLDVQPVLSSGVTGRGNLLYLQNLPDGTFRFGVDFWGVGAQLSPPLTRPAGGLHVLEIFVGPQVARRAAEAFPGLDVGDLPSAPPRLAVWLDGRLAWSTPVIAHADSYDFAGAGTNTQGFSTAGPAYAGHLRLLPSSPDEIRGFAGKNLAPDRP